jgi:hypothetical protein
MTFKTPRESKAMFELSSGVNTDDLNQGFSWYEDRAPKITGLFLAWRTLAFRLPDR